MSTSHNRPGFLDFSNEISASQRHDLEANRHGRGLCPGCGRPGLPVSVGAAAAELHCRACRRTWTALRGTRAFKAAKLAADVRPSTTPD